ncbi:hypothetical protein K1719_039190 [Acacia pycnantha]|nr:hypothetical protein K1719_039190 [Acacia pycnantha]
MPTICHQVAVQDLLGAAKRTPSVESVDSSGEEEFKSSLQFVAQDIMHIEDFLHQSVSSCSLPSGFSLSFA